MENNSNKQHWKKFFNYDYLGCYSLQEGKDLILTIKKTKKEVVTGQSGQKDDCLVAYFHEEEKGMILNRTNCRIIEKLYRTPYVEEWIGKRIQIYAKSGIKAFGVETEGLRVREFIPEPKDGKKRLKEKIRNALKNYEGEDKGDIRQMLNDKQKAGEDTVIFLNSILEQIAS